MKDASAGVNRSARYGTCPPGVSPERPASPVPSSAPGPYAAFVPLSAFVPSAEGPPFVPNALLVASAPVDGGPRDASGAGT